MTQVLICPTCGLAFTDQRQHREWHVDRAMMRQRRDYDDLQARLNALRLTAADAQQHGWDAAPVRHADGVTGVRDGN